MIGASHESATRPRQRVPREGRGVLYTPWFWRYIMTEIRNLPDAFLRWASL